MILFKILLFIVLEFLLIILCALGFNSLNNWELRRDIKKYNARFPRDARSLNITSKEMRKRVRETLIMFCCDRSRDNDYYDYDDYDDYPL